MISLTSFKDRFLGDSVFWKTAMSLALPIALQNLLTSSLSLIDTLMIGRLGDMALSAVGMAGQWCWLMNLVIFGLCSGSSVFFAQYWGVKNTFGIRKVNRILIAHIITISVIFLCIGRFYPEWVVGLFNKKEEVIALGSAYLKIACWSLPGVALGCAFAAVLRSTENPRLPLYSSIVSTLINIIFNYLLIYGKYGFPALGVRGAAIATCIAAWINPIVILIASFIRPNHLLPRSWMVTGHTSLRLRDFYRISSPVIANESLWGLGTLCSNIILGRIGYEYYAALTIFRTCEGIAFVFFIGLCNACCVMVGKSIGSGRRDDAIKDARRFSFLVPVLAIFAGWLLIAVRTPVISIFNGNGALQPQTIDAAKGLFLVFGLEMPLRYIPYIIIVGIFRSGGDTVTGMAYDLIFLWSIALPAAFVSAFVLHLPFVAVFAVMIFAEDTLKAIFCLRRFFSMKWIRPVTEEGKQAMQINN